MSRNTVAIDFDGVIRPKDGKHHGRLHGEPLPGAEEGLRRLAQRYHVVIFTARSALGPVREWLHAHGLGEFAQTVTNVKPAAVAYLDDHAAPFTGWDDVEERIAKAASVRESDTVAPGPGLVRLRETVGYIHPRQPRDLFRALRRVLREGNYTLPDGRRVHFTDDQTLQDAADLYAVLSEHHTTGSPNLENQHAKRIVDSLQRGQHLPEVDIAMLYELLGKHQKAIGKYRQPG